MGPGWTDAEWEAVLEQHGRKCLKCGAEVGLVADHVIPMARGGEHHIRNIQPLCSPCNLQKGLTITDFRVPKP